MPMQNAATTITTSTSGFSIMFIPNMGRVVKNRGNKAQWIAQATDAVIPKASQLIFRLIGRAKVEDCN